MKYDKKKIRYYLIWTFVIAWILQGVAIYCVWNGIADVYQAILAVSMFAPLVGALLSKHSLKGLGWKPQLKGKVRYYLLGWFGPAVVSVLGAALFFILFRGAFDPNAGLLAATIGATGMEQLAAQGLTPAKYLLISSVSAVTYAPLLNMFAAIGEEVGWRGVLSPALRERFGKVKGSLLMGLIWGVWHWPIIILAGYEYGLSYVGAPVLGPFVFLVFTFSAGVILDWLYRKSGCIWLPAITHGAINAFAAIPLYFLAVDKVQLQIFGPAPVGLVAGIPFLIAAIVILCYDKSNLKTDEKSGEEG
ncbi:MAG: CPBP family intramembrane metalloprotease [Lachnospiraceae bacterium]|nr:CPBP family intramembrane metalloprotease [Lachnospiraceae bacterium]